MKRSNTKFDTTITISKKTRDTLKVIKQENDYRNYDEVISNLLSAKGGFIKNYEVVKIPQTALVLDYIVLDEEGVQLKHSELEVTFRQLRQSDVGQLFYPMKEKNDFYVWECGEVVWKDENFVVLKIVEEVCQDELTIYNRLVGVELL